jgi:hypothetical protein
MCNHQLHILTSLTSYQILFLTHVCREEVDFTGPWDFQRISIKPNLTRIPNGDKAKKMR